MPSQLFLSLWWYYKIKWFLLANNSKNTSIPHNNPKHIFFLQFCVVLASIIARMRAIVNTVAIQYHGEKAKEWLS